MNTIALMIATVTLGVDYGYQPLDDGQMEYIIQLEPQTVKAMLAGEAVFSEIVPEVKGVRRFRIVVGTGKLPRITKPAVIPKNPTKVQPSKAPDPPEKKIFTPPIPRVTPPEKKTPLPTIKPPLDPNRYGANNPTNRNPTNNTTDNHNIEPPRFPQLEKKIPPIKTATHTHDGDDIQPHTETSSLNKPVINKDDPAAQEPQPIEKESQKTWGLLILALIGLFVSVGANLYQGWIGLGLRGKYHDMVDQLYAVKKKQQV